MRRATLAWLERNGYLWALLAVVFALALGVLVNFLALSLVISRDVRLDQLIGRIVYYDEVLTMSARMAAATGEDRWSQRYGRAERQLAVAIYEAAKYADGRLDGVVVTSEANDKLIDLESRALDRVSSGDLVAARSLVFGDEYETLKREYTSGVETLRRSLADRLESRIGFAGRILLFSGVAAVLGVAAIAWALHRSVQRRRVEARMNEELVQLARRGTVGELAAGLAHELNQPLAAAANFSGAGLAWLERSAGPGKKAEDEAGKRVRESLEGVAEQITRAGKIIAQMRAFAKGDPGELCVRDAAEIATDSIELVKPEARSRGVTIISDVAGGPFPVMVDRVRLQQVIVNLLVNAVDACESSRENGGPSVWVALSRDRSSVCLRVTDTGPGVDPKHVVYLFEAFFTTKPHGLGLGLSLSRDIIEAMGGRLTYEVVTGASIIPERGFVVTLPVMETPS